MRPKCGQLSLRRCFGQINFRRPTVLKNGQNGGLWPSKRPNCNPANVELMEALVGVAIIMRVCSSARAVLEKVCKWGRVKCQVAE